MRRKTRRNLLRRWLTWRRSSFRCSEKVNRVHHTAPHLEVHPFGDLKRGVGWVLREQPDLSILLDVKFLHHEIVTDTHDDDAALCRFDHPVDDEERPFMDTRLHRITFDPDVEGRERVFDQIAVEINAAFDIILGGGRESGRYAPADQWS